MFCEKTSIYNKIAALYQAAIFSVLSNGDLFNRECHTFCVTDAASIGASHGDSVSGTDAVVVVLTFFGITFHLCIVAGTA